MSLAGSSANHRRGFRPRPKLGVATIAVISGVFTGPATLEEAEAEADAMEETFASGSDPGRRPGRARVPVPRAGL